MIKKELESWCFKETEQLLQRKNNQQLLLFSYISKAIGNAMMQPPKDNPTTTLVQYFIPSLHWPQRPYIFIQISLIMKICGAILKNIVFYYKIEWEIR